MLETYADSQETNVQDDEEVRLCHHHIHSTCEDQQMKESMLVHSVKAKTLYVFNNPKTNAIEWTVLSALFVLGK